MSEATVIAKLEELGLNSYEAKAFFTLTKMGSLTAAQLSAQSGVPKQRIYDVLDSLVGKGLVLITHSKPRLYSAVTPQKAIKTLLERARALELIADELLYALKEVHDQRVRETYGERTVWVLTDQKEILGRVKEKIAEASRSVLIIASRTDYLKPVYYDVIHAKNRGVHVTIIKTAGETLPIEGVREVPTELPNVAVFDDRSLIWLVTPGFAVYSECPFCAYEVIKFCRATAQAILAKT